MPIGKKGSGSNTPDITPGTYFVDERGVTRLQRGRHFVNAVALLQVQSDSDCAEPRLKRREKGRFGKYNRGSRGGKR